MTEGDYYCFSHYASHTHFLCFLEITSNCFCLCIVKVEIVIIEKVTLLLTSGKCSNNNIHLQLTFKEFRYIRTSSNCFRRKKHEAIHCRPGIVSTSHNNVSGCQVTMTTTHRIQLRNYQQVDNIVVPV